MGYDNSRGQGQERQQERLFHNLLVGCRRKYSQIISNCADTNFVLAQPSHSRAIFRRRKAQLLWLHHGFREKGWVKTFLLFRPMEFWHHAVSVFSSRTSNKKSKDVSLSECCVGCGGW